MMMTEQRHYFAAMTLVLKALDEIDFSDVQDVVEDVAEYDQWYCKKWDTSDVEAVQAKVKEARNLLASIWRMQ